jgi:hypothetical protein
MSKDLAKINISTTSGIGSPLAVGSQMCSLPLCAGMAPTSVVRR